MFYRKIQEIIVHHLEQESHKIFHGAVKLDESYLDGIVKASMVTVLRATLPCLAY